MAAAYTRGIFRLASGATIWTSVHVIRAILVRSGYPYSPLHNVVGDLSDEVTGGGYARQDLGTKSVTEHDGDGEARYFAGNITFTNLTTTNVRAVVLAHWVTSAADSPLLFYLDFASLLSRTAQDLVVAWPANGIAGARLG